ncbi:DUF2637 domain-containing protein [Streptomyces sp. NPDC017940]|uniref:DUF2637 domain-containing protein n=1 Tax=Streptomyces sp. NPDC017940 TaxID=3365017 RepID=UPI0037898154
MQSTESVPTESAERMAAGHWRAPRLSRIEWVFMACVALGALAVGALGLYASFENVTEHMRARGFEHPEIVPIAVDIAIPVFSMSYLLLVRLNMGLGWVRWLPWVLTYVTIHLNVTSTDQLDAQIAHAALPALWIAFTEVVAHGYRVWIGRANGTRTDPIPLINWVLSPFSTVMLWRHMKLWEVTSYKEALELRKQRLRTRAALTRLYGRRWRHTAPIEMWFEYRIGALTSAQVYDVHRHGDDPERLLRTPDSTPDLAPAPIPAPRDTSRELENADETTALPPGSTTTSAHIEGDTPYTGSDVSLSTAAPAQASGTEPLNIAPRPQAVATARAASRVSTVVGIETRNERDAREQQERQDVADRRQANYDRAVEVVLELVAVGESVSGPRIAEDDRVSVGTRSAQRYIKKMVDEGIISLDDVE